MGSQMVREGLSDFKALHYAQWQLAAFRMPAAKQEALGSWDTPPWLSALHTDVSGPKDFQAVRQEKTLALAWAWQACAKGLGIPSGILCNSTW